MNFKEFIEEKKFNKKSKHKPRKKKSKSWKDPLNRHSMKISRGSQRLKQRQIPKVHQHGPGGVSLGFLQGRRDILPMTQKLLDVAKSAQEGIWRVSWVQALELADKYHINMPNKYDRSKKLGKTTILLWRKAPGVYFLVKNKRLKRTPRFFRGGRSAWDKPIH